MKNKPADSVQNGLAAYTPPAPQPHISDKTMVICIILCLLCLAVFAPWWTVYGIANFPLIKWLVAGVGSSILLLLTVWRMPYLQHRHWHISWIKLCFLLLFCCGTVSVFWSVNVDFTLSKWLLWCIGCSTFLTAYYLQPNQKTLYHFSWVLLICAGFIACIGILQYFGVFTLLKQYAPPASTFGNRNVATHVIVLTWPVGLYLLTSKNISSAQTWLVTSTLTLIMTYIAYTQTRSSWVAMALQVMVLSTCLWVYRQQLLYFIHWNAAKKLACWVSLGAFLLLINLGPSGWEFFLSKASTRLGEIANGNERLDIWTMDLG